MKINKTYDFYLSLLKEAKFLGDLEALKKIQDWQWNSSYTKSSSLFLVFKGENVDAIRFVPQVLQEGCRCFVVPDDHEEIIRDFHSLYPEALFILEDPLNFLKRGACSVLSQMPNLLKIGVSGSNGKTTTKELLYGILSSSYKNFYVSQGNYNSEIGMSLSILQLSGKEEIAVFEMGINKVGEMDELVDLLKPDWVVLTSFSEAHVGLLGSLENIIEEKSKITRYAKKVFCPEELASKIHFESSFEGEVITYSLKDIYLESVTWEGQSFVWDKDSFFLPLLGKGSLWAVCASLKVSQYLGINHDSLREGFLKVSLPQGRMDLIKTSEGVDFLNDAYNANLASLKVLLSFLEDNRALIENYKRVFIVFSGFKEMGQESLRIHGEAIKEILNLELWEKVFLLGEELCPFYEDLKEDKTLSFNKSLDNFFLTSQEAFKKEDLVILKGSRSSSLERLIKFFE